MSEVTEEKEELTTEGTEVHGSGETLSDEALGLAFYHAMGGRGAETNSEYMERYTKGAAAVRENVEAPVLARVAQLEAERDALQVRNDNQKQQLVDLDGHISPLMSEALALRAALEAMKAERDARPTQEQLNCYMQDVAMWKNKSAYWEGACEVARLEFAAIQAGKSQPGRLTHVGGPESGYGPGDEVVPSPTSCCPPEADRVRVAPVVAKSAARVKLDWVREVVREFPSPVELTKSAKATRYAALWKGLYHA